MWEVRSPYRLTGRADSHTYTSWDKALDACTENSRCVGFTEHNGKFVLNNNKRIHQTAGHQAYIKGSMSSVSHDTLWEMLPGKVLRRKVNDRKYNSLEDAAAYCSANAGCKGISLIGVHYYQMSTTEHRNQGNTASWIKRGEIMVENEIKTGKYHAGECVKHDLSRYNKAIN